MEMKERNLGDMEKKNEKNLGCSLTKQERNQRNMPCVMGTRCEEEKQTNKRLPPPADP